MDWTEALEAIQGAEFPGGDAQRRSLLELVEWTADGDPDGSYPACPVCGGEHTERADLGAVDFDEQEYVGHRPDCALAAALGRQEEARARFYAEYRDMTYEQHTVFFGQVLERWGPHEIARQAGVRPLLETAAHDEIEELWAEARKEAAKELGLIPCDCPGEALCSDCGGTGWRPPRCAHDTGVADDKGACDICGPDSETLDDMEHAQLLEDRSRE